MAISFCTVIWSLGRTSEFTAISSAVYPDIAISRCSHKVPTVSARVVQCVKAVLPAKACQLGGLSRSQPEGYPDKRPTGGLSRSQPPASRAVSLTSGPSGERNQQRYGP